MEAENGNLTSPSSTGMWFGMNFSLREMGLGRIPAWSQFNLIPCPGEEFLQEFLKFKEHWPRSCSRGKDGFGKAMGEEVIRG